MRNIRKILALLLALFLTAALCGCAASRMDDGLAGTSGSDSVKPADATDFMSYAGPIFPLTLAQAAPALSADREILLDCAPYAEEYGAAVTVTDRYTIQNSSGEACTATVLYPFVSSLSNLEALRPQLSVDGAGTETAIYPGVFPGWFGPASPEPEQAEQRWNLRHAESWTEYQTLLSSSYQTDALAPKPLPDQTVYVYSFTASGNTTASAATLAITVDADPEQTTILTYGINGYGLDDRPAAVQLFYKRTRSVPASACRTRAGSVRLCHAGLYRRKLRAGEGAGCTRRNRSAHGNDSCRFSAADCRRPARHRRLQRCCRPACAAAAELLTGYGVCSAAPAERYSVGMLDSLLQDAYVMQRICYAAADVTIPTGGTVCIEVISRKPHSFDFFGFYDNAVDGYGIMTTESILTLKNQTARLDTHGLVTIYGQNFGFAEQGSAVPLSAETEYYYLNLTAAAEES